MTADSTRKERRLALARGVKFTCRRCGDCCRHLPVALTPAEATRYTERDWTPVLDASPPVVVRTGDGAFLARQASGACLFLDDEEACRIHTALGAEEKPLACRLYPFTIGPAGADGRPPAGARFTCSSVAAGEGKPLSSHRKALQALEAEREAQGRVLPTPGPRPFGADRSYAVADVERLLDLMAGALDHAGAPFAQRLLAAIKFLDLVANSRFPSLTEGASAKAVTAFAKGVREQIKRDLLHAPPGPAPLAQRLLLRLILAFTARRKPPALVAAGWLRRASRRLADFLAGLGFLAGTGRVAPLGRQRAVILGDVRRAAPKADLDAPEADGALTRYLLAKLSSRFLYDPEFQVVGVLPALGLLLRQVPIVVLLARAACLARGGEALSRDDYAAALRTADAGFGAAPWDAGLLGRLRGRLLADVLAPLASLEACAGQPVYPPPPLPEALQP